MRRFTHGKAFRINNQSHEGDGQQTTGTTTNLNPEDKAKALPDQTLLAVVDVDAVEQDAAIQQGIAESDLAQVESELHDDDLAALAVDTEILSDLADNIENTTGEEGDMNVVTAHAVNAALEAYDTRYSMVFSKRSTLAVEDFRQSHARTYMKTLAIESVMDRVKGGWKLAVEKFNEFIEWIIKTWKSYFGTVERVQKRAASVASRVESAQDWKGGGDVVLGPAANRLVSADGTGITPEIVLRDLERLQKGFVVVKNVTEGIVKDLQSINNDKFDAAGIAQLGKTMSAQFTDFRNTIFDFVEDAESKTLRTPSLPGRVRFDLEMNAESFRFSRLNPEEQSTSWADAKVTSMSKPQAVTALERVEALLKELQSASSIVDNAERVGKQLLGLAKGIKENDEKIAERIKFLSASRSIMGEPLRSLLKYLTEYSDAVNKYVESSIGTEPGAAGEKPQEKTVN